MRFLICFLCCFFIIPANAMESYADLVEELMPAVVNISTERQTISGDDENIDNVMLEPSLDGREALGSGFFIRDNGYILTNEHVINGAKKITVITNNGISYEAKIAGIDKPSDLAVLKIGNVKNKKEETFHYVKFGDADDARIGDKVLTFGNPYGLGVSVSQGIISAKSRNIGLNEQQYIQTDAAINQGNSGGPMFNLNGEVIGVNAAIFTTKGASGVGFSLPSNIANWVSKQLIDSGKVRRSWIGMSVANGIDRYTNKAGFVVTEINENSNAYKEGIRVGDIIIAYNDIPAENIDAFLRFTETMEPGQALRLKTISFGEEIRNVVRVQEMPSEALKNVTNKALTESSKYYNENIESGIFYISELHIAVKEASPRGLMVMKIERKSPLYGTGIKKGDILLEADRTDIYTTDNLLENIRNAVMDDFRPITFFVQGIDNTFYTTITMEPEND
ncbi:MAG: trypsin-like peptidase domain-containing protein [Acetobacter sp.]|nr:trypsin-like peptidase domain-containing protein [Acetobacter sp.]